MVPYGTYLLSIIALELDTIEHRTLIVEHGLFSDVVCGLCHVCFCFSKMLAVADSQRCQPLTSTLTLNLIMVS